MSILVNRNTKVITQGITGKTGQFHTRMCRDYANGRACFVAAVNPKKAGEDFEGIPIYATVADARAKTDRIRSEAERITSGLVTAYRDDPSRLPQGWQGSKHGGAQLRTIGDFIAGMTDRYAIARHEELVGPVNLPADRF